MQDMMYDMGQGSDGAVMNDDFISSLWAKCKEKAKQMYLGRITEEVVDDIRSNFRCVKQLSKEAKINLMKKVENLLYEYTTTSCENKKNLKNYYKLTHCINMKCENTITLGVYEMFKDI